MWNILLHSELRLHQKDIQGLFSEINGCPRTMSTLFGFAYHNGGATHNI